MTVSVSQRRKWAGESREVVAVVDVLIRGKGVANPAGGCRVLDRG